MNLKLHLSKTLTKIVSEVETGLVVLFNIAMLIIPIITNSLSATNAAKYAMIANTALVLAKSGQRAVETFSTATGIGPSKSPMVQMLPGDVAKLATGVAGQVSGTLTPMTVMTGVANDAPDIAQIVTDAEELIAPPPATGV